MTDAATEFVERFVVDRNQGRRGIAQHLALFGAFYQDDWPADSNQPKDMRSGLAYEFEALAEVASEGGEAAPALLSQGISKALIYTNRIPVEPAYYARLAEGQKNNQQAQNAARVRLLIDDDFKRYVAHAFRFAQKSIDVFTPRLRASNRAVANLFARSFAKANDRPRIRVLVVDGEGARPLRGLLPQARVELRLLETTERVHERAVIIDGEKYMIGSHGFTPTSLFGSREVSVAVEQSPTTLKFAAKRFEELWAMGVRL